MVYKKLLSRAWVWARCFCNSRASKFCFESYTQVLRRWISVQNTVVRIIKIRTFNELKYKLRMRSKCSFTLKFIIFLYVFFFSFTCWPIDLLCRSLRKVLDSNCVLLTYSRVEEIILLLFDKLEWKIFIDEQQSQTLIFRQPRSYLLLRIFFAAHNMITLSLYMSDTCTTVFILYFFLTCTSKTFNCMTNFCSHVSFTLDFLCEIVFLAISKVLRHTMQKKLS